MKKKTFHKLSVKIVLINFIIIFGVIIIINIFFSAFGVFEWLAQEDNNVHVAFLFVGIIMATLLVIVTSLFLSRFVVSRLYDIMYATTEVKTGNFDILLNTDKDDEISELAANFNAMTLELKANEYLSRNFIRDVSHEFKTPLAAIRAYTELIQSEEPNKEILEYSEIVIKEVDKLVGLTKSILQLSSIDASSIVIKDDEIDPDIMLNEILVVAHPEILKKNLLVVTQNFYGTFKSNYTFLYQAMQNLVSNAIKFSHQDSKIDISLSKDANHSFIFSITNYGEVIDEASAQNIFTHFYVRDPSRNKAGSGLGLTIAKRVAHKLGGDITFVSTKEDGTTFTLAINGEKNA